MLGFRPCLHGIGSKWVWIYLEMIRFLQGVYEGFGYKNDCFYTGLDPANSRQLRMPICNQIVHARFPSSSFIIVHWGERQAKHPQVYSWNLDPIHPFTQVLVSEPTGSDPRGFAPIVLQNILPRRFMSKLVQTRLPRFFLSFYLVQALI